MDTNHSWCERRDSKAQNAETHTQNKHLEILAIHSILAHNNYIFKPFSVSLCRQGVARSKIIFRFEINSYDASTLLNPDIFSLYIVHISITSYNQIYYIQFCRNMVYLF